MEDGTLNGQQYNRGDFVKCIRCEREVKSRQVGEEKAKTEIGGTALLNTTQKYPKFP
jgi:hypothetical protein